VRLHFNCQQDFRWMAARALRTPPPPESGPLSGKLKGRNVVIFLTDALHAQHMSGYGNGRATTPGLDRLAAEGVRFETAYSQTSWTLPSVASLFTSLEQERHGVTHLTAELSEVPTTLAESFRAAGYRTVGLVQNGIVWPQTGLDRGFDRYDMFRWNPESFLELIDSARATMQAEDRRPLFLYVHVIPPHGPFVQPDSFRNRFDVGYAGMIDGEVDSAIRIKVEQLGPNHPDVVHFAALYDEFLAYADDRITSLVADVRSAGKAGDWLFVHLSDHGEAFMQHGALGHGLHVYEEEVRIPLILCAPGSGLPRGMTISPPVSLLDVYPTLVDLCGLPAPGSPLQGRSLGRLLARPEETWTRPLFLSSRTRGNAPSKQVGLRLGGYKLVVTRSRTRWDAELFNLSLDPREEHDLSEELPLLSQAMERMLRAWLEGSSATRAPRAPRSPGPKAPPELDEGVLRELRALGYFDGER
jgi:arylsulfatase A-like enzyme